jgi:cytochrome P450
MKPPKCWLTSLTTRHGSPIIQAFIKPGSLPWVVVTDPYESQDILQRRTKEFDRSGFIGELIGGILPEQHIQFPSTDARFKNNRNLINHLMAPTFVKEVSAPEVYKSIETLIKVWQRKCDLAKGRPFGAHGDITYAALDAIFASSFGLPEEESITIRRLEAVSACTPDFPDSIDETVSFPEGKVPSIFNAALTLANSVTSTQLSPFPVLTSWILRQLPYMKRATAIKDAYIHSKVDECIQQISNTKPSSALHSVLLREKELAAKQGRQPSYHSRAIADEFFGFMLAGHDTSATAVAWGVKYLTSNPHTQTHLRNALQTAFPVALSEQRAPTYAELSKTTVPYLDAVAEEILRHANTIAFVVRRAMQDTSVLGHHIPKGTDVFLMANGAGYLEPNMPLPDNCTRSPGADPSKLTTSALTSLWDDADIEAFKPERWLKPDGSFNPIAGPQLAFGLGPRGCFGRRLAVQALRMEVALLIWEFRFLMVPEGLGSFEAVQKFAREPVQCYVRLARVEPRGI